MPECGCNCFTFWTVILIGVGAIAGMIVYQDQTGNKIPFIGDKLPNITEVKDAIGDVDWPDLGFDFEDVISFDKDEPGSNAPGLEYSWNSKKDEGLKLKIVNALSTDWHSYFDKAIADWENGSPDVLTLQTSIVSPDPDCTPESDIMKVCNKDYGETGWKGINEILTQGKTIVASVAKMNENYLAGNSANMEHHKQYTMCHEIGHGFGLPHQDESFTNKDLGTCMDYSDSPQNNLVPNQKDFDSLNILYGDGEAPSEGERNLNSDDTRVLSRGSTRYLRKTLKYDLNGEKVDRHIYVLLA